MLDKGHNSSEPLQSKPNQKQQAREEPGDGRTNPNDLKRYDWNEASEEESGNCATLGSHGNRATESEAGQNQNICG